MTVNEVLNDNYWLDRVGFKSNIRTEAVGKKMTREFAQTLIGLCQNRFFGLSLLTRKQVNLVDSGSSGVSKFRVLKAASLIIALFVGLLLVTVGGPANAGKMAISLPILMLVGFVLPDYYAKQKAGQRLSDINFHFPSFLDLLALYTSSEGFDNIGNAIISISRHSRGVIGEELRALVTSYRFVDRDTFWDQMQARFNNPLASELASTVRLTEKYGGNISEKMVSLASEANKDRVQKAKKQGQKAAASLLLPLMLFHFPVALFLLLGPLIMSFGKMFGN